jgi:hypothetical protein
MEPRNHHQLAYKTGLRRKNEYKFDVEMRLLNDSIIYFIEKINNQSFGFEFISIRQWSVALEIRYTVEDQLVRKTKYTESVCLKS